MWSAGFGKSGVTRYAPDGSFDRKIEVPMLKTTSIIFAGDHLTDAYITSAGGEDKAESGEYAGALYRLDADFSWVRLDDGITCSNGPCWSPDGRTFYFADSPRRTIWAYDYDLDSGALHNKRVFVSTGAFDAFPDGATVDAEGHLWSALFGSGRIARFAPDGSLDRTVELPVAWVSSVMFGGPGLDVLFATSIGGRLLDERDPSPDAGALFAIHGLGVKGLPEPRFAG